ncbi:MAG: carboxypeptidase regulatory-like domain-containing protein [Melioribacteraceae bacterium]
MRNNNFVLLIIALILIISFCKEAPTDAPEIITRIAGKVIDGQTNEVLSGVQISTTPPTSSFITQQDGSFSLSDLLPGQYRINVTKDGYNDNGIVVLAEEGKTTFADIQMFKLGPELYISIKTLDFNVALTTLTFNIINKTKVGMLTWAINSNHPWLEVSPRTGSTYSETDVISVTVKRESIDYGNYSSVLSISSDYGTKEINVIMTKSDPTKPQLTVFPTYIDFGKALSNVEIDITNTGIGTLSWMVEKSQSWILVNAASGNTLGGAISKINISVNRSGMEINSYTGIITISSEGKSIDISVRMEVTDGGLIASVLQGISKTSSSITLGWTKSSDPNFASYKLFTSAYTDVNESSQLLTTISNNNDNNYVDKNLSSGRTYYYKLYVYNSFGIGTGSNEVAITTDSAIKNWNIITQNDKYIYYDVYANHDDDVWAVGSLYQDNRFYGYIKHWNGTEWKGNYYSQFNKILQIFFMSENNGYALAINSSDYTLSILKYNGISWNIEKIEGTYSPYEAFTPEFTVLSNQNIYLVDGNQSKVFHFDGTNWSNFSFGVGAFRKISSINQNELIVANEYGDIYKYNGMGWAKSDLYSTTEKFSKLVAINSDNIWGLSNVSQPQPMHFNGTKWIVYSTWTWDKDLVYLDNSNVWTIGDGGYIYKFNGSDFEEFNSPTTEDLYAIFMLNTEKGWAVGNKGVILKYY